MMVGFRVVISVNKSVTDFDMPNTGKNYLPGMVDS
jgi:hypothetical protein